MSKKLYVGNLLYETTDEDLKIHFGSVGTVVSATVIKFRDTGKSKGFGFVEMTTEEEAKKAIDLICGALENNKYSAKFIFYCYHGVGHGVMDSEAYYLKASLLVCDSLDSVIGRDGCWQGAFMENVNAGMRGEAPKGAFSQTDPLFPCNEVQEKYRHECYINHAGWLMKFFGSDVNKAIAACLNAQNYKNICLQSIGLMATNPVWQPALLKDPNYNNKDTTEVAKEICLKFPQEYREQCVVAGVDNILNFDELNTSRAQKFCDIIDLDFKNLCYRRIGSSIRSQVTDRLVVLEKCSAFTDNFKQECLRGAGL